MGDAGREGDNGYTLGVDLGTTYSAAATARDGRAERFPLGNRTATIPSVVCLREDGEVLVGEAAQRRGLLEPTRTAREFKRRLGDPTPLLLGGTPYGAEALMAHLLAWIVGRVVEQQGAEPDAIVLSHPANWGPYKLDLLEQTVRLAEVGGVSFLTEPEAAAVHYAARERLEPGEVVAVYDFGGGTFDAAVLRYRGDGFELVGTPEGMERIGGIDFDQAVFAHVDAALGGAIAELDAEDSTAMAAVSRLRDECQEAKEQLSHDTDVDIPVLLPGLQTEVRLTRPEFESMIRPRIGETIRALERAVGSAGVAMDDVAKVLLVGGTSRIPLVGQLVREGTGRPIAIDAHPKFAIAVGAALVGAGGEARSAPATPAAGEGVDPIAPVGATAAATGEVVQRAPQGQSSPEPADDPATSVEGAPSTQAVDEPTEQVTEQVPVTAATGAGGAAVVGAGTGAPGEPGPLTGVGGDGGGDRAGGRGQRWPLLAGGGLAVVLLVVLALSLLGGADAPNDDLSDPLAGATPSEEDEDTGDQETTPTPSPTAEVEPDTTVGELAVQSDGTIEVPFTTTGFAIGDEGYGVEVGWVDEFSQPIDGAPYRDIDGASPFTGFDVLARPVVAAGVCVQTVTPDGELPVEDPEHCAWLDPSIRSVLPGERLVALDQVSVTEGTYVVDYTAYGYEPELGSEGTWHVHFYWYPTADEDVVGANIPGEERGSWVAWDAEVFDAFTVAQRPADATHVCGVVAEHDHTILLQEDGTGYPSGSCLVLP